MSRRTIVDDSDEEDNANANGRENNNMDVDVDVDAEVNNQTNGRNAPSAQHQQLQQHFESQAGVRPSNCWLEQCVRHLGGGNDDEEAVWNQILHADLRDVVRETATSAEDSNSNSANGGETTAAVQLRKAIAKSKDAISANANNAGNSNVKYESKKVSLPSDFQLLVQMEEVVDVTMNAEQQLASMGGGSAPTTAANNNNNSGPQQGNRNPKYRCLKMAFSDGYHPNGKTSTATNDNDQTILLLMAMETSPIQNLSVSSSPGLKLLLHGPINVRLGLLQLNDENVKVIGGEIESWKEVWKKAREKSQREKGLGVDPTIKALIWNPLMGDEEEEDEGEGESGDVTAAPAAAPPPPIQQAPNPPPPIQRAPQPPPPQPIITPNQPSTNPYSNAHGSSQNNQIQTSYTTNNASSRSSGGGNMRQQTLDSYPKRPRPETTRLLPSNNNNAPPSAISNSRLAAQQNPSNNPYQRISSISNAGTNAQTNSYSERNIQSNNTQPPRSQQQQQQQQRQPPMLYNTNVIPIDDSLPSSTSHKPSTQQPQRVQPNPYASLRQSSSERPAAATTSSAKTNSATVPTSFTSNPSFSELKSIVQSFRSNRALYEQYYGKTITVPCKINSQNHDNVFNIVKAACGSAEKKKSKLKKEKKYEFLLVGKFMGPKQSDGSIACRVERTILEPYFDGYSAGDLRKLSREDKARSQRIVNQGSSQFIHDFNSLGQVQMKLFLTADEFFVKTSQVTSDDWMADTSCPFLVVTKRN